MRPHIQVILYYHHLNTYNMYTLYYSHAYPLVCRYLTPQCPLCYSSSEKIYTFKLRLLRIRRFLCPYYKVCRLLLITEYDCACQGIHPSLLKVVQAQAGFVVHTRYLRAVLLI